TPSGRTPPTRACTFFTRSITAVAAAVDPNVVRSTYPSVFCARRNGWVRYVDCVNTPAITDGCRTSITIAAMPAAVTLAKSPLISHDNEPGPPTKPGSPLLPPYTDSSSWRPPTASID